HLIRMIPNSHRQPVDRGASEVRRAASFPNAATAEPGRRNGLQLLDTPAKSRLGVQDAQEQEGQQQDDRPQNQIRGKPHRSPPSFPWMRAAPSLGSQTSIR